MPFPNPVSSASVQALGNQLQIAPAKPAAVEMEELGIPDRFPEPDLELGIEVVKPLGSASASARGGFRQPFARGVHGAPLSFP